MAGGDRPATGVGEPLGRLRGFGAALGQLAAENGTTADRSPCPEQVGRSIAGLPLAPPVAGRSPARGVGQGGAPQGRARALQSRLSCEPRLTQVKKTAGVWRRQCGGARAPLPPVLTWAPGGGRLLDSARGRRAARQSIRADRWGHAWIGERRAIDVHLPRLLEAEPARQNCGAGPAPALLRAAARGVVGRTRAGRDPRLTGAVRPLSPAE